MQGTQLLQTADGQTYIYHPPMTVDQSNQGSQGAVIGLNGSIIPLSTAGGQTTGATVNATTNGATITMPQNFGIASGPTNFVRTLPFYYININLSYLGIISIYICRCVVFR